jgi:hypothetical protein
VLVFITPAAKTRKEEPRKYEFKLNEDPFGFEVVRAGSPAPGSGSAAVWNTTGKRLLYKEQYLELNSWTEPSSKLYGLGERISSSGAPRSPQPVHLWPRKPQKLTRI